MELEYKEENFNSSEILFNAQLIADAFADSLRKNNCMLMLTVALHQEINDAVKDMESIDETITETDNKIEEDKFTDSVLDSIQNAIKNSKDSCFTCKLAMPTIDFNFDMGAVMARLRVLLDGYLQVFKIGKLDLCQAAYGLRKSCLPDILKLIILLITAYAAIIMLKNISSISVIAFIKGVISSLLDKIFSTLKMSISIGTTNISCIIEAFKEISESVVPTQERILAGLEADIKKTLSVKDDTNQYRNEYVDTLNSGINRATKELSRIDSSISKLENNLNDTFKVVSDTMKSATKEVNDYIQGMIALKTTFDCEAKRSGTDIVEVIKRVNNLIQVLNLLSAVALSIAKKDATDRICSSPSRINSMSSTPTINEDVQMKDIIEEYYGKEAEIIENPDNGVQIIIYDKPKETVLPKIDLLNCSIDDFIESHTIDNIIKVAADLVKTPEDNYKKTEDVPGIDEGIYIIKKPSPEQLTNIDNIVNILYDDPIPSIEDTINNIINPVIPDQTSEDEIINVIGTQGVSSIFKENNTNNSTLNCRTIDDVMSVLDQLRR